VAATSEILAHLIGVFAVIVEPLVVAIKVATRSYPDYTLPEISSLANSCSGTDRFTTLALAAHRFLLLCSIPARIINEVFIVRQITLFT